MNQENSCAKRVNFVLMGVNNKHPKHQHLTFYGGLDALSCRLVKVAAFMYHGYKVTLLQLTYVCARLKIGSVARIAMTLVAIWYQKWPQN